MEKLKARANELKHQITALNKKAIEDENISQAELDHIDELIDELSQVELDIELLEDKESHMRAKAYLQRVFGI